MKIPITDIQTLINYIYQEEERHYEESEPKNRKNHIFTNVKNIAKWLKTLKTK